jgi:tetratricopeptide (TPR) repeat protein
MSNKDLTIFEKRLGEWELSHPKYWIATADRGEAAEFISNQTNKIVKSQLEAADRIIISQNRIADELDVISEGISEGIEGISEGIEEIQAELDWGFSEIIWQLELQTEAIKNILKVLQAPLGTQAKELKKRAEEAYRNNWIDDAFEDFLESEKKNRYDFTIHQSLGNIYLFHKKNSEKALEHYEKAVKYAVPYSSYYTSIAFIHIGLVRYLQKDFQKAYEATLKAIKLSPDFYKAHFQCAQYCACLGKYDEAIEHLKMAIGNRYYCLKANSERDFKVMKRQLRSFFEELRDKAQKRAKSDIKKAQELVQDAESYGVSTADKSDEITNKFKASKRKLSEAKVLLKNESLFDCWDATYKAYVAQKMATDASIKYLSNQISKIEEECKVQKAAKIERIEDLGWGTYLIFTIVTGILIYYLCIFGIIVVSTTYIWTIALLGGICFGPAIGLFPKYILTYTLTKIFIQRHIRHYKNKLTILNADLSKAQDEEYFEIFKEELLKDKHEKLKRKIEKKEGKEANREFVGLRELEEELEESRNNPDQLEKLFRKEIVLYG